MLYLHLYCCCFILFIGCWCSLFQVFVVLSLGWCYFLLFISSKILVVDFQVSGFYLSKSWLLLLLLAVVVVVAAGCCWLLFSLISYFELLHIVVLVTIWGFFSWLMFSFLFTVFIIVKSTESVEISTSSFSTWDKPLKHFCFLGNTSEFYILQSFFLVINSSGWKRCRFLERELCIFIRLGIAKGRQAASAASVRCRVIKTLL